MFLVAIEDGLLFFMLLVSSFSFSFRWLMYCVLAVWGMLCRALWRLETTFGVVGTELKYQQAPLSTS